MLLRLREGGNQEGEEKEEKTLRFLMKDEPF